MTGKLNKNIGFTLLPFAFLFLFEPGYTLVDPLPDFLGYIIICLAIINLADICPRIMDSFCGFRKGILINILRFVAAYLLDRYFEDVAKTFGLLIFCFVFSVFELIAVVPAYKNLFEGLLHLGMMHDGNAVYEKKQIKRKSIDKDTGKEQVLIKESKRNITEKLYSLTVAFLLLRHIAMALPEFTTLISNSEYEFVKILRYFGIIIIVPIGIVWLIRFIIYCAKIRKDTSFIQKLSDKFTVHAAANPKFYVVRSISTGIHVAVCAFAVSVDFYSKYINILPDFVFFSLILITAIILRKYSKKWIALSVSSGIGIVVSAITTYFSTLFHSEFYPNAIRKNLEAYNAFYRMLGMHIFESVCLFVTVILTIVLLWDVYKTHLGDTSVATPLEIKVMKREFFPGAIATIFTSLLNCVGNVYYVASQPFYNSDYWYFYYSAVIAIAVSIIFAFSAVYFVGTVLNLIKFKYRLYI